MTTIYLTGSRTFGATVADELTNAGHGIVGVAAPEEHTDGTPDRLRLWAERHGVPVTTVKSLRPDSVPDGVDMIIAAHSHAFVGRLTRARAKAAIGYHPSLLPLHRGRDAVKWQARLHERVVGGTVYHLTDRVDGGPIHSQQWAITRPGETASEIWSEYLFPIGVKLLTEAADSGPGGLHTRPQDDERATWEPALDTEPLYRPELLELL